MNTENKTINPGMEIKIGNRQKTLSNNSNAYECIPIVSISVYDYNDVQFQITGSEPTYETLEYRRFDESQHTEIDIYLREISEKYDFRMSTGPVSECRVKYSGPVSRCGNAREQYIDI